MMIWMCHCFTLRQVGRILPTHIYCSAAWGTTKGHYISYAMPPKGTPLSLGPPEEEAACAGGSDDEATQTDEGMTWQVAMAEEEKQWYATHTPEDGQVCKDTYALNINTLSAYMVRHIRTRLCFIAISRRSPIQRAPRISAGRLFYTTRI